VAESLAAARERLAAAQEGLLAALVAGGPAPPGFAADRVAATAEALLRKRVREVAAAWPALGHGLGPAYAKRAGEALRGRPPAGALTDGLLLARALAAAGPLPPAARAELAGVEAGHRLRGGRLVHRRGLGLRLARTPGGVAVAVRAGHRVRWLQVGQRRASTGSAEWPGSGS
jgi:hypothetical protein